MPNGAALIRHYPKWPTHQIASVDIVFVRRKLHGGDDANAEICFGIEEQLRSFIVVPPGANA